MGELHSSFDLKDAADIDLDETLDDDHTWTGITCLGEAGEDLAVAALAYLTAAGTWFKTDADAAGTTNGILAIATEAITNGNTGRLLLMGFYRDDTWETLTIGGWMFVDTTAGDISQTSPTGVGDQVRKVGVAVAVGTIWFNPDSTVADVIEEKFLPANEGYVSAGTPGASGYYGTVSGGANAAEPIVYFTMKVPTDFISFLSVKAIWATAAATKNMYWRLRANYGACGEALDTHVDNPGIAVTACGVSALWNCQEAAGALTLVDLSLGDMLGLTFERDGTHGDDTLDDTMIFAGLLFTYVRQPKV